MLHPFDKTFENNIKLLRSIIVKNRPDEFGSKLECACAFCSFIVQKLLHNEGYNVELVIGTFNGEDRCWVQLYHIDEVYIIDLTLKQFKESYDVFIGNSNNSLIEKFKEQFSDEKALSDLENWGEQSPFSHMDTIEKIISKYQKVINSKK